MKSWSAKISAEIDRKLADTRDKDKLFFRVNEFKRNIARVDAFSAACPHCKSEIPAIETAVEQIDVAVETPGRERREYDRLISRLARHMQKEHGFYAPFHFSYVYALYGLLAGLALSLLLYLLFPHYWLEMFAVGLSSGIVVSYVFGSLKDKKVRAEKKLM